MRRGEPLFTLRHGDQALTFTAPLSGKVKQVNYELDYHLDLMRLRPYEQGWICAIEPTSLTADLKQLRIGGDAVSWYQAEIKKYGEALAEELAALKRGHDEKAPDEKEQRHAAARAFARCFLPVRGGACRAHRGDRLGSATGEREETAMSSSRSVLRARAAHRRPAARRWRPPPTRAPTSFLSSRRWATSSSRTPCTSGTSASIA